MKFTIIRGGKSGPSSRQLRDGLIQLGHEAEVGMDPHRILVNWSGGPTHGYHAINGATYTDKYRQLCELEKAGLRTTPFSRMRRAGWMGRTLHHGGGRDFRGQRQRRRTFDYYTEPIETVFEYRLHAVRLGRYGYISKVQKKYNKHPEKNKEFTPGIPIRNRQWGWHMRVIPNEEWTGLIAWMDLKNHAIWSLLAQDWDMGAVDLAVNTSGQAVILEVNSCPSLKDETSRLAYANAVVKIARERGM